MANIVLCLWKEEILLGNYSNANSVSRRPNFHAREMWRKKRKKICTIDLDGVLNYYPDCWVDFINRETQSNFKNKNECKKELSPKKYAFLKDKYRKSNFKANLRVRNDALELLKHLRDEGYSIVIVTRRPFEDYPSLADMTRKWLDKNNVPYDMLVKKSVGSFKRFSNLDFHIEDEIEDANLIASAGYKIFLCGKHYDKKIVHPNVTRVKDLTEILVYLENEHEEEKTR